MERIRLSSSRSIKIPVHRELLEKRERELTAHKKTILGRDDSKLFEHRGKTGNARKRGLWDDEKESGVEFGDTDTSWKRLSLSRRIRSSVIYNNSNQNRGNADPYVWHANKNKTGISNKPKSLLKEGTNFGIFRGISGSAGENFLRKGSCINKSIMLTVLRSKSCPRIVAGSGSYDNCLSNRNLGVAIYEQVPLGLHDCVGIEEMLRVSNVYTGGGIGSINMNRRVIGAVEKFGEDRLMGRKGEEDVGTVKSIRRW